MSRYNVFDVETPNRMSNRMSAIGITVIENGMITDEFYSLVNPETHFDYFNTQLTWISEETVRDASTFPKERRRYYNDTLHCFSSMQGLRRLYGEMDLTR